MILLTQAQNLAEIIKTSHLIKRRLTMAKTDRIIKNNVDVSVKKGVFTPKITSLWYC